MIRDRKVTAMAYYGGVVDLQRIRLLMCSLEMALLSDTVTVI